MLSVILWPDPTLEGVSEEVTDYQEVAEISEEMFKIMSENNGIGLAAPQVGISKRFFVMEIDKKRSVIINPKIKNRYGTLSIEEGCLSFPGIRVKVERFSIIDAEYKNTEGTLVREKLNGLIAICFQHELDHLNGKTFVDKTSLKKC
jgi:peptide deformylase